MLAAAGLGVEVENWLTCVVVAIRRSAYLVGKLHYCLLRLCTSVLLMLAVLADTVLSPVVWGIRIQPTFALVRVVRGD